MVGKGAPYKNARGLALGRRMGRAPPASALSNYTGVDEGLGVP